MLKKKIGQIFKELLKFLPKKFSLSSQKYGFGIRDPRSGKKPIPDPASRGQKGTGSRIRNTVIYNQSFYQHKNGTVQILATREINPYTSLYIKKYYTRP
jgi:hypothetical protein